MSEVKINVRDNGPFLVAGPITLVDAEGNSFALDSSKPAIALCRCGASANRPFCDGSHKSCGFESADPRRPTNRFTLPDRYVAVFLRRFPVDRLLSLRGGHANEMKAMEADFFDRFSPTGDTATTTAGIDRIFVSLAGNSN